MPLLLHPLTLSHPCVLIYLEGFKVWFLHLINWGNGFLQKMNSNIL
uniref:Uncharacterized protein n=1 Tax=Arundo donax TaxID=35708 RepID=A0A0A8Y801_ARUDO